MVKNVKNEKDLERNKNKLNDIFKTLKTNKEGGDSKGKIASKDKLAKVKNTKINKLNESLHKKKIKAKKEEYSSNHITQNIRRRTIDNLPIYTMEELNIGFNLSSIHFITRRNKPLGSCYVYLEENEAKDAIKLLNGKFFKQKFIITHSLLY
eukprot:XP_766157.1 hypothetical protein [Theileria parva strain Muguga]